MTILTYVLHVLRPLRVLCDLVHLCLRSLELFVSYVVLRALPYTPCVFYVPWSYTCPIALPTLLILGALGFYSYFIKQIVLKKHQMRQ